MDIGEWNAGIARRPMKSRQYSRWCLLAFFLCLVGLNFLGVPSQASAKNFTTQLQLPKNQLTPGASYYNLKVVPGSEQLLTLSITNPSDQAKTVKVTPVNATTADSGTIAYMPSNRQDESAETTFTKMTSVAVTVQLAPRQQKTVTLKTKIPANGFQGEIRGGLFVADLTPSQSNQQSNSTQFHLNNRFAEVTPVILRCNIDQKLRTNLKLAQVTVNPQPTVPTLTAKLRNLTPAAFGQLKIQAKVAEKATGKIVATQTTDQLAMAPNSWFNHPITLGKQNLAAGHYTLKLDLTSGKRDWHFEAPFQLSKQQVKQHNISLKKASPARPWGRWLLISGTTVSLLIGAYWLGRRQAHS